MEKSPENKDKPTPIELRPKRQTSDVAKRALGKPRSKGARSRNSEFR